MSDVESGGELPDLDESVVDGAPGGAPASAGAGAAGMDLIMGVPLRLSVELGRAELPVRAVLELSKGSVVELDRLSGEPADVFVNDRLIARGELTQRGDRVAVKILELVTSGGRVDDR